MTPTIAEPLPTAPEATPGLSAVLRRQAPWLLACLACLAFAYWRVVPDMVMDWYLDENYSHGFLVPLLAGYFIYLDRERLAREPVAPCLAGLLLLALGVLQLYVGFLATEYFTMRLSLVLVLAGMVLTLLGPRLLRLLALPVGYLVFMVPLPYIAYDAIAFPLKLFVTNISTMLLKASGVAVLREGNILQFADLTLEVADACSGLRSLMSLAALGVAYAALSPLTAARRVLLVLATVPIAIATNVLRVFVTGVMAVHVGPAAAEGFFHEFTGLFVFVVSLVLFAGTGELLRRTQ